MIKINKLGDLNTLATINPFMRGYILNLIAFFCNQYKCSDISEFGAFFVLQTESDINNFKAMGLLQPLTETTFEYVDLVTIETNAESIIFISALTLLCDDFGIVIFAEYDLLPDIIKKTILKEYTKEKITINVSKSEVCNYDNRKINYKM